MIKDERIKEIVLKLQSGDLSGFDELYMETIDYTYRIASLLIKNQNELEDVIQNAYLKALSNITTLNKPDCFYAWLRVIVENECKNHDKKKKPLLWSGTERSFEFEVAEKSENHFIEAQVENEELSGALEDAIEALPRKMKVCISLYYFEGMGISEIAKALSVPVGTVKSRLYKARKMLEKELNKKGIDKDTLHSVGLVPLIVSALSFKAAKAAVPASIASNVPAAGVAAGTTAVASAGAAGVAGTAAAVIIPKVAAAVVAAGVVAGASTAVKTYVEKKNAVIPLPTVTQSVTAEQTRSVYHLPTTVQADASQLQTEVSTLIPDINTPTVPAHATASLDSTSSSAPKPRNPAASSAMTSANPVSSTTAVHTTLTTAGSTASTTLAETTRAPARTSSAATEMSDEKNYAASGGIITGYSGVSRDAVIPQTVGGSSVTAIGAKAFENNRSIATVTLPAGVTDIGLQAFCGCTALVDIRLPSTLRNIGIGAFYGCESLSSVSLPQGTIAIGDEAFAGCSSLQKIYIPDSVTSIAADAFDGCEGLIIECPANSAAHDFATENAIEVKLI